MSFIDLNCPKMRDFVTREAGENNDDAINMHTKTLPETSLWCNDAMNTHRDFMKYKNIYCLLRLPLVHKKIIPRRRR